MGIERLKESGEKISRTLAKPLVGVVAVGTYAYLEMSLFRRAYAVVWNAAHTAIQATYSKVKHGKAVINYSQAAQDFLKGDINALPACAEVEGDIPTYHVDMPAYYKKLDSHRNIEWMQEPFWQPYTHPVSSVEFDRVAYLPGAEYTLASIKYFIFGLAVAGVTYAGVHLYRSRNWREHRGVKSTALAMGVVGGALTTLLPLLTATGWPGFLLENPQLNACMTGLSITYDDSFGPTYIDTDASSHSFNSFYGGVGGKPLFTRLLSLPLMDYVPGLGLGVVALAALATTGFFSGSRGRAEISQDALPLMNDRTSGASLSDYGTAKV